MTENEEPKPVEEATEFHPNHLTVENRVWRLERNFNEIQKSVQALEAKPKFWKDRAFYAGLIALPLLVLSGWILTYIGGASESQFFQPLPYLHSMLGTEEAMKAYVAPKKMRQARREVHEEISEVISSSYAEEIDEYLKDKQIVTLESLTEAIGKGKFDNRIKGVGGRKQNFNDFFISRLGLIPDTAEDRKCDLVPVGAEVLQLEVENQNRCFLIGESFKVSDGFIILRPKDVRKVRLEIFVVSEVANGTDDAGLTLTAYSVPGQVRNKFFEVRVNAEPTKMANQAVEGTFANGADAYKYIADFNIPEADDDNDRSYDVMTVSLNLLKYDTYFGSERRDKTFTVFVVPTFIAG